jgi:hypothetical protein
MRKLTDLEHKLVMQLFMGKVVDIIGIDKVLELIKESKKAILEVSDEKQ